MILQTRAIIVSADSEKDWWFVWAVCLPRREVKWGWKSEFPVCIWVMKWERKEDNVENDLKALFPLSVTSHKLAQR